MHSCFSPIFNQILIDLSRYAPTKMERSSLTLQLECLVNTTLDQFNPTVSFRYFLSQRVSPQECCIGWLTTGVYSTLISDHDLNIILVFFFQLCRHISSNRSFERRHIYKGCTILTEHCFQLHAFQTFNFIYTLFSFYFCSKLKLDENVANIWPEFGSNGKDLVKVWIYFFKS